MEFSMAEPSFQSTFHNNVTRTSKFFQSFFTCSVSINLIEDELFNEKSKHRKLDNDRRELQCKIKELVEKLKATEILIDISNAAIQVLEKAMEDSGKGNGTAQQHTPVTMPFFSSASKPTDGFGDLFKPMEGTWECKRCHFRNRPDKTKCLLCGITNPRSTTTAQQNTPALMPLFSSASKPASGFGDLFKPKEGTWECKSCCNRNSADKTKCVSCDTENGTSSASKPSSSVFGTSGFNTFESLEFDSSDTPKSTFSFGPPKSESGFVFGTKPESQPATFTFVQSTVSSKTNEIANSAASSFRGSSQKVLGEKSNAPVQGIFDSATNFTFRDLAKSRAESGEFKFSSPQKYEFSFEDVRPRSPSKAPKSPRSPAALSDADEEDEVEDSDADNLYFEPVIPLPPKVEVKTGEEEEKVLFCKRAKLFRFSNSEWKERGIGDIKILFDEKTNRVRLLMRREQVLKVCLNHHLTKDIKFEWRNDKSLSWTATDFSENKPSPELLAVRFKTNKYAEKFKKVIHDALKVSSEPGPSPKSENITLKPDSTFSFKVDDPVKVEPQGYSFGSFSLRIGGSPQQSQTVFGSAANGFSFKDSKAERGTSPLSSSLKNNASNGSIFSKPSVFGGFGVALLESKDDDIEVVYESTVPEEKIKLAQELQLPKFFFLYENKPPCPGCIGCEDKIPPYKSVSPLKSKDDESQDPIEKTLIQGANATQHAPLVNQKELPSSAQSYKNRINFRFLKLK